MLERIASKENLHRFWKDLSQMQVDGARRPVIVNVGIKIQARVEKCRQRRVAGFVHGEPFGGKKSVMNQSLAIDGPWMNAAHVRVARYIIEIIECENAAGQRLQKAHPFGLSLILLAVFLDRKGDIFRPQLFAGRKGAARTAT